MNGLTLFLCFVAGGIVGGVVVVALMNYALRYAIGKGLGW